MRATPILISVDTGGRRLPDWTLSDRTAVAILSSDMLAVAELDRKKMEDKLERRGISGDKAS